MKEFEIRIRSIRDVVTFVNQATKRPYTVRVGNANHQVNGKSFMEMFCLNFKAPLMAQLECSEEELLEFRRDVEPLLVK